MAADGGRRWRDEPEGEGANGNHGDAHQSSGEMMEWSETDGEAGAEKNRRRGPADGRGVEEEIEAFRASPACAAGLRRTRRRRGVQGASRQGGGGGETPAGSSGPWPRVSAAQGTGERERGGAREGMSEEEEEGARLRGWSSARGRRHNVALHHRRTATQVVLPSGRRRKKGREKEKGDFQ